MKRNHIGVRRIIIIYEDILGRGRHVLLSPIRLLGFYKQIDEMFFLQTFQRRLENETGLGVFFFLIQTIRHTNIVVWLFLSHHRVGNDDVQYALSLLVLLPTRIRVVAKAIRYLQTVRNRYVIIII